MTGKILLAFVMELMIANFCLAERATDIATVFSDSKQLSKISDTELRTKWDSLSEDQRIKVLREANLDPAHPLRSKKSALREIIVQTPAYVAGSETATLHRVYIDELGKLGAEVWNVRVGADKRSGAERFETIKAHIAAK